MPAILFPSGMKHKSIKDEKSEFMFFDPHTTDGRPNTTTVSDIRKFLTGNISERNENFVTGDAVSTLFKEKSIPPREELDGHIAQFNASGQLDSGGSFLEFQTSFISNTSLSFK